MKLNDFFANRQPGANQMFPCPGSNKTVMLSSYIYWTDMMACALLNLGYNVLVCSPWYSFWTDDAWWNQFDGHFTAWINTIKQHNVICMIGGNTSAIVPHPRTGELLHRAAGVPVLHYWWDEPRTTPPMSRRGIGLTTYLSALRDDRTLNVVWDKEVMEELEHFMGLGNCMHLPLATTPEVWQEPFKPVEQRTKSVCFLGNCHWIPDAERASYEPDILKWAQETACKKKANLDRSIVDCLAGQPVRDLSSNEAIARDFRHWQILNAMMMEQQRGRTITALAAKLGSAMTLIGANWDKVGLTAEKSHSGVPGAKTYYASHKASVNLYGGSVHGGLPLRPYEIASANGLIFTHYARELPNLYEPDVECVAFRNEEEMNEKLDRILKYPAEYNSVVQAGYQRTLQKHTWENRMRELMRMAGERFNIPV